MNNRDVFDKDIDTFSLENQGVAKVDEALDDQQRQTLRFELETFVCKGHYEEGYTGFLNPSPIPCARSTNRPRRGCPASSAAASRTWSRWPVRLWTNEPFPDGRTPRDIARLPAAVADALKELDTLARQRKATCAPPRAH
jgi:hypothetical protein